tara:strand:+ start:371 stop:802 length:432 start_codon:yes stop_codon:yes gene_type:complete
MDNEKARWAKLAGLPNTPEAKKQQLDENFVGYQMVGNIFDREKEKYEDAFEYFLNERYEETSDDVNEGPYPSRKDTPEVEENLDEKLATQKQLDLNSLKSSILRAIPNFTNRKDLGNYINGLIDNIDDDLFDMEMDVDLSDKG